jgi:flagellar hook assembly protein FlgD
MTHRHVQKSVIALFMSVMLLFSSLGALFVPSHQAFASSNEGSNSTSVINDVYGENDQETVNNDYASLSLGDTSYTTNNLTLPTTGQFGSNITWASSDSSIASNGVVTRPVYPQENKLVTLTATITNGEARLSKVFQVRVIATIDKVTAAYMLHQSKYYYDVVKSKTLGSWWDYGAVFSGWGTVAGYTVNDDYSGELTGSQPTDYAGLIVGMISTGKNPYLTPKGKNLIKVFVEKYQDAGGSFSTLNNQQMWSIIALNAANAEVIYNRTNPSKPYNKEGAVKKLIAYQAASGSIGGLDLTGMALIALTGSKEIEGANEAITKAVNYLKNNQLQSGQFAAGWGNDNGNTDATVISGLVAAGEDLTSSKWTVGGKTPIDTLAQYQGKNGGFMYRTTTGKTDNMASYQAIIALGDLVAGDSVWKRIKLAAPVAPGDIDVNTAIEAASNYFISSASAVGSDWSAIALARSGQKLPETYMQHLQNVVTFSQGDFDSVTDLERTILGIGAANGDASNVGGYNLIEKLYNHNSMTAQGINGPVFALLALDSQNYSIPVNAKWTRDKLIQEIITRQNADGGFVLNSGESDPDITATVVTALDPYKDHQAIISAGTLVKAVDWLSQHQQNSGGYLSGGVESSESVAQAIIALTSRGIDPTGAKYTKNGVNLIKKLFQFRLTDGSFSHTVNLVSNGMATDQALRALVSYKLFLEGTGERLYDLTKPMPGLKPVPTSQVKLRIEGPENRFGEASLAEGQTPLQALEAYAIANGIELKKDVRWGMLNLSMNGIHSGYYGDQDYGFWDFAVHRGDNWITYMDSTVDQAILQPSDEVVIFYDNYNTMPIDSITVEPQIGTAINEDVNFTVHVNKTQMNYATYKLSPIAAGNVNVSIYDSKGTLVVSQKTDESGKAAFGHLLAGNYVISVSDYVANSAPNVVHTTAPLQVSAGFASKEIPLPAGDQPRIVIPFDNQDYIVPISNTDANKEITVEIPNGVQSRIHVGLPSGTSLPQITALKGNVSMTIPKGAQITSGDASALELITTKDNLDSALKDKVGTLVPSDRTLDSVNQAITFGGGSTRVVFDQFVTLTFNGMKGKEVAYIENGVPQVIQKFDSDAAGLASEKLEYAYEIGNALIIKTKHFTDFIAYTSSVVQTPGGGGPGTDPKPSVTLSVDKLTIDKGYVVPSMSVVLQSGDTPWSVLKRTLDSKGIVYKFKWYDTYGSVYLQSIDGDGEFDHGSNSGWMYNVNGSYPGYGASSYVLKNGDNVQWRYTTNLGKDVGEESQGGPVVGIPTGQKPIINIPSDLAQDYTLNISDDLKNKELITVNIPNVNHKVFFNLETVKDSIPLIKAVKGDITLTIDKGTALKSGNPKIEVLTSLNREDTNLQNLVKGSIKDIGKNVLKLTHAFAMGNGNEAVQFDKPLTFVVAGGKDQLAGFIEGKTFTPIEKYESDEKGLEATKGKEKITYAYVKDNDLIIRTNHFTSFLSYTVGVKETETTQVFDWKKLYTDSNSVSPWAIDAISEASQKKFIEGNEGKLAPQAASTRAEFTKILVNVLGLEIKKENAIHFQDVSQNDWYYPYVNTAYQAGMISGYDAEHFNPNEKLTREQMAVIIANALTLPKVDQTTGIEDMDQVSDWAKSSVQTIMAGELMTGWNNRFQPSEEVTREMAIVVAMRAYKKR